MPKQVSQTSFAFLNALPAFLNAPHLTMLTPRLQNENTWSCSSREGAMIGYFFDPRSSSAGRGVWSVGRYLHVGQCPDGP